VSNDPVVPHRPPQAVALAYGSRDAAGGLAPRVVANGKGAIAHAIIARAQEFGVPVHESPELVGALIQLDLDQRIPPALYIAVAEVLAWAYRIENKPRARLPGPAMPMLHSTPLV